MSNSETLKLIEVDVANGTHHAFDLVSGLFVHGGQTPFEIKNNVRVRILVEPENQTPRIVTLEDRSDIQLTFFAIGEADRYYEVPVQSRFVSYEGKTLIFRSDRKPLRVVDLGADKLADQIDSLTASLTSDNWRILPR